MNEHTKEPWRVELSWITGSDGKRITCPTACMSRDDDENEANERRIVACVNACAGVATEELEQSGFVAGLVELGERAIEGGGLAAAGADWVQIDEPVLVTDLTPAQRRAFGSAYGVMIKELMLLTRAIFVLDANDIIRYIQIVPEITNEPDYAAALEAVKKLA